MTETTNFKFNIIDFDKIPWHTEEHDNWHVVDALMARFLAISSVQGVWQNALIVTVGDRYIDTADDTIWEVLVAHTTESSGTFAESRIATPANWQSVTVDISVTTYATATTYTPNTFLIQGARYGLALSTFTSNSAAATTALSYDADVTAGNIETLIDGGDLFDATIGASNGIVTKTADGSYTVRTLLGGTGIDMTNGSGVSGAPSVAIDSSVVTLTGSQTLTTKSVDLANNTLTGTLAEFNTAVSDATLVSLTGSEVLSSKTLTSPVINTSVSGTAFLDEDNMASNSATKFASQQSIKAYVDSIVTSTGIWSDVSYETSSPVTVTLNDGGTFYSVDATSGPITLNLPSIATLNLSGAWAISVKKTDSSGNAVTIDANGSDTISGSATFTITGSGTGVTLVPDVDQSPDDWAVMSFGPVVGNPVVDNFAAPGDYTKNTTTNLTLSVAPVIENNIEVYFDGVTQHHNTYSVSGTTLTFDASIGADNVEVIIGDTVSIGTPSDGTITAAKITSASQTWVFVGEVTATGFTGTLDGVLGSGTPADATVDTLIAAAANINGALVVSLDSGATNTVTDVAQLSSTSSGTPAAGIGVGLTFNTETAAGNTEIGSAIRSVATDVDPTNEDFDLVLYTMLSGGTAAEVARFKSDLSTVLAGTLAAGAGSGFGIAPTDGTLHVHTATAGAVTANTSYDDLVVENDTHGGISILVPDNVNAGFSFGTLTNNVGAVLVWDYDANNFLLGPVQVGASTILRADNAVANLTLSGASGSELAVFVKDVNIGGIPTSAGGASGTLWSNSGVITINA